MALLLIIDINFISCTIFNLVSHTIAIYEDSGIYVDVRWVVDLSLNFSGGS